MQRKDRITIIITVVVMTKKYRAQTIKTTRRLNRHKNVITPQHKDNKLVSTKGLVKSVQYDLEIPFSPTPFSFPQVKKKKKRLSFPFPDVH